MTCEESENDIFRFLLSKNPSMGKYISAGVLVNHEAKLKGVAKASGYTQKPGLMST